MNPYLQRGMTFIELIISMVIIGIAVSGVLSVMNFTTARSADPMIQHQAIAIAEAYLEEILTRNYDDADCPIGSDASRDTYCAVDHYDDLSEAPTNQFGAAIGGLGAYTVDVSVVDETLSGVATKRIDVGVSHPSGIGASLSGYRASY